MNELINQAEAIAALGRLANALQQAQHAEIRHTTADSLRLLPRRELSLVFANEKDARAAFEALQHAAGKIG